MKPVQIPDRIIPISVLGAFHVSAAGASFIQSIASNAIGGTMAVLLSGAAILVYHVLAFPHGKTNPGNGNDTLARPTTLHEAPQEVKRMPLEPRVRHVPDVASIPAQDVERSSLSPTVDRTAIGIQEQLADSHTDELDASIQRETVGIKKGMQARESGSRISPSAKFRWYARWMLTSEAYKRQVEAYHNWVAEWAAYCP